MFVLISGQNVSALMLDELAMPRRLHHHLAASTDATPRPQHEHHRIICRTSRSALSPESETRHPTNALIVKIDTEDPGGSDLNPSKQPVVRQT